MRDRKTEKQREKEIHLNRDRETDKARYNVKEINKEILIQR